MAEIFFSETTVQQLRDKVIVITGGAQGIGAATVALAFRLGAHVYFGDLNEAGGKEVEANLQAESQAGGGSAHFMRLDVRDHDAQIALFDAAYKAHGRVDVAISCAAISDTQGLFDPENLNLETVRQQPQPLQTIIDINLTSVIFFARIALAYMKTDPITNKSSFSKSIVLLSSIAGITEAPGLFGYSPAKHGVIGLMRALRPFTPSRYGLRANAICPWATDTPMFAPIRERWASEQMPLNSPEDVGRVVLQCAADPAVNGNAVFVGGGRAFDTEGPLTELLPHWLGEMTSVWLKGQDVLGLGDEWTKIDEKPSDA